MSSMHNKGPNREARRATKGGEIIHREKLFGGKFTAEEAHAAHVFKGQKCAGIEAGCIGKLGIGSIVIRTFMSVKDLKARDPNGFGLLCEIDPDAVARMLVSFKGSDGRPVPYVRIATVYACKHCAAAAERAAAHGPSYAVVEIDRGPGADPIVSGYSGPTAADRVTQELVETAVSNMKEN
jgi:hypothetical protein